MKGCSKSSPKAQGKTKEQDLYTIMMWGSSIGDSEQNLHWLIVNIHGSPKTTLEESLHTGDTIVPYKLESQNTKYTYHLGIFKQNDCIPYIKLQRQNFDVNDFIKMYDLLKLSEQVKKS
jgi:hypothetical protein